MNRGIIAFMLAAGSALAFSLQQADRFFQQQQVQVPQTTPGAQAQQQTRRGVSVAGGLQDAGAVQKLKTFEQDSEALELEIEAESPQQDDLLFQVEPDLLTGGKDVNVSFYQAHVKDVIRTFAKKAGVSIVISPLVDGEVTSQLYGVPVRSALKSILSAHKLYYIPENDILQIVTEAEYRIFAQKKLTESRVYEVRWASLRKAVLAVRPYLTRGLGKLTINRRTSRMVITDLPNRLRRIESILTKIEVENQQILITARVLEIEYGDETNVGAFYQIVEQNTQRTFLAARFQSARAPISEQQGGLRITAVIDNAFSSSSAPKAIQLGLAAVGVSGEVTIVSSPRILVEENSKALIQIGTEIPYPTTSTTATGLIQSSFEFMQAGTRMIIVPRITDKKKKKINLLLDIESSSAQLLSFSEDGSVQAPQKNLTRTQLTANCRSGQTIVIAGFINYIQVDDTVGIPILKDIPVINFLFATTVKKLTRREIAILITSKVIDRRGTPVKKIYRQVTGQATGETGN